jgi:hypothetical protein
MIMYTADSLACKCGCRIPINVRPNLAANAQFLNTLQKNLGLTAHVTSAYRCVPRNRAVGGVPNSYHITGKAVDFYVLFPEAVKKYAHYNRADKNELIKRENLSLLKNHILKVKYKEVARMGINYGIGFMHVDGGDGNNKNGKVFEFSYD